MSRFQPIGFASLSVTAASDHVAIPAAGQPGLLLQNDGAATMFVRWGTGTQVAAMTDMPLLSGQAIVVRPGSATDVAAMTGSGATTLRLASGSGSLPKPGAAQGTSTGPSNVIVRGVIDPN